MSSKGKCPIDHENMTKEEIVAYMSKTRHGDSSKKNSSGKCPIDYDNMTKEELAKVMHNSKR